MQEAVPPENPHGKLPPPNPYPGIQKKTPQINNRIEWLDNRHSPCWSYALPCRVYVEDSQPSIVVDGGGTSKDILKNYQWLDETGPLPQNLSGTGWLVFARAQWHLLTLCHSSTEAHTASNPFHIAVNFQWIWWERGQYKWKMWMYIPSIYTLLPKCYRSYY